MTPAAGGATIGRIALATCAALPLLVTRTAHAQDGGRELHAELLLGTAWSLPTPLVARIPPDSTVRLRARWSTRPWADAPYYAYRLGVATGRGGARQAVEAELLHHKLYLENPHPPIEHFEVTHGYNLANANAVRPAGRLSLRLGLGLVIAHAEGRVAGRRVGGTRRTLLGGGYHVAGLAVQAGIGRRCPLGRGRTAAYAIPEARVTASWARVPLGDDGGSVLVPNVAVHALAGLGVRHRMR